MGTKERGGSFELFRSWNRDASTMIGLPAAFIFRAGRIVVGQDSNRVGL